MSYGLHNLVKHNRKYDWGCCWGVVGRELSGILREPLLQGRTLWGGGGGRGFNK